MLKVTENKFAHFLHRTKANKNVTHLLHSQWSMLYWRLIQVTILKKFKHEISLLTTAITLLNESRSELAQIDLSLRLIGADRLKTKVDFCMTFSELADWLSRVIQV